MPSLGSLLEIAKTGLITQQKAMNVTAHNIANASTEGYSRQRVMFNGLPALRMEDGVYGNGVTIDSISAVVDPLLERSHHRELSNASGHGTRADMLRRIEGLLGEPSEFGLSAALDAFYSAWSDLATSPTSSTIRASVRQETVNLAGKFNEIASGLDAFRQEVEGRMTAEVVEINSILEGIADINRQIVTQETGGGSASDLRDARGRLINQLSESIPIETREQPNGSMMIRSSGVGLVDGVYPATVELRQSAGVLSLGTTAGTSLSPTSGALNSLMQVANVDIPGMRQTLDDLAETIVTEVNTSHALGTSPAGTTGVNFFDPAGTTATSMNLSADVLASLDAIAAGTPDGLGAYRGGANDVALTIAGLRDLDIPAFGATIGEYFSRLVFDVGQGVRSSSDAADVHTTLADQANIRRMGLSGVSVDEELVRMIEFQTAYQASARVVSTADEMLQSLLTM